MSGFPQDFPLWAPVRGEYPQDYEIIPIKIVTETGEVVREVPAVIVPGEEVLLPHPLLRLWPPPEAEDGGVPGEYDVTLRGSEEEYFRFHRALVHAGFWVDESGGYEVYVRVPEEPDAAPVAKEPDE